MFSHRLEEKPSNIVALHWFMLSFNGGCINAGGFLLTGKFVSHITGFATLFGVAVTHNRVLAALSILSVPLFFLLGAFVAGLLIDRPIHLGKKPHFDWVMGLSATCLYLAASGVRADYLLMALLCLASGLQNGAITSSSGKSVRTTHLTGLTTDLGLSLAQVFIFGNKSHIAKREMYASYLRLGSILFFVVGSAVGALVIVKYAYKGFLLSALIATYAAWHGKRAKVVPHAPNPI